MNGCIYCEKGAALNALMKEIAELTECTLYMHRDQTHPGRVILAVKRHIRKITELSREEYMRLMGDVYDAAEALTKVYHPGKLNLLIFGDKSAHMHIHLVPKYENGKDWGKVFLTDEPAPVCIAEEELDRQIEKLREILREKRGYKE